MIGTGPNELLKSCITWAHPVQQVWLFPLSNLGMVLYDCSSLYCGTLNIPDIYFNKPDGTQHLFHSAGTIFERQILQYGYSSEVKRSGRIAELQIKPKLKSDQTQNLERLYNCLVSFFLSFFLSCFLSCHGENSSEVTLAFEDAD